MGVLFFDLNIHLPLPPRNASTGIQASGKKSNKGKGKAKVEETATLPEPVLPPEELENAQTLTKMARDRKIYL
jgi:hypothetical protein